MEDNNVSQQGELIKDSELEEIDRFLIIEGNYEIFQAITSNEWIHVFRPIEFIRLFSAQVAFINSHRDRPLHVSNQIIGLDLSDDQLSCLITCLLIRFEKEKTEHPGINAICGELELIFYGMEDDESKLNDPQFDPYAPMEAEVQARPDVKAKIAYLVEARAKWRRDNYHKLDGLVDQHLSATIDSEIEKYKTLLELERENMSQADDEYNPKKRGLTRQLAILLIEGLIPNIKDAPPNAKGEFLGFLTGFDAKGLSNKWGDYSIGSKTYKADLEAVEHWKRKLRIKD